MENRWVSPTGSGAALLRQLGGPRARARPARGAREDQAADAEEAR